MNIVSADTLNSIPFLGIGIVFLTLVYWIPAFFIVYHLTRFGISSRPKFIALLFFIGSVILFSLFIVGVSQLDLSVLAQQAGSYIKY